MLNEHHLDQHDRVGPRPAVVMAVVRCQPFIQPFVIHDPLDLPQQMGFRHQRLQIYKDRLAPCVFSPVFHENTPVSSILPETRPIG